MRDNFDLPETDAGERQNLTPPSSSTPKDEVQWLPLQNHPVFAAVDGGAARSDAFRAPKNLLACDGASRLYCWDSHRQCLHRISIRLGDPDQSSVLAASPSKVLQADVRLPFVVNKISINRNGSAILLAGSDGLCVMYLYGRASTNDGATICRTVSIGSQIYFNSNNIIRTLEISWHPYSDTHLGILSSDSVFRLFDLSSALGQPEQEYYLQPVEPGRCRNASSICPVDFSFGGDHLWDRFSIFVLFSDGSIYILCPVVPFGSVYKWESMLEIYSDAQTFGLKSANPRAVSNSNLAISWLEATFPELHHQEAGGGNLSALKAQPYTLFDASISMQGPLPNICHGGEEDSEARVAECEGRAVSLLYNTISKDSVLVTAWSGGQLQIDALADEIQPVWVVGSPPRLCVDSCDRILGVAMICESIPGDRSIVTLDQTPDHTIWSGHLPPLLRLAMVDLALPGKKGSSSLISMFVDPLIPERIYTLHDGGIDSIVLHFLPFTSQTSDKDESMRTPSVHSVLSTCQGQSSRPSPLFGFVALSDSFGYSWIVGLTSSQECIVLEMKSWDILLPILVDTEKKSTSLDESRDVDTPDIISKELLDGPKPVLLPPSSPKLRSITADSIEGRSTLHQYFKLFHENYVEYAHKVYFELKHHGPHLKKIIENQHDRLREAQQKLLKVEEKQEKLDERVSRTTELHSLLEERLQRLRKLPGMHKRPLSKAEREFKSDLDRFTGVELDALHSSIEALNARLQRYTCSLQNNLSNQQRQIPGRRKNYVQDNQISDLQSSIAKLSLVNGENTKKVKLLESALQSRESSS
ncbi:nuclear pore complex protein NUP88-like [Actinidia eriantha]|uniref:nuclear pore complex protein NUP88-like n=1 Tax=Actinidia eriantha TaxID=165200 RepID=UPI00258F242E|nr:nuclear pore complex protein NUP88-like [Actinidia eriantha]